MCVCNMQKKFFNDENSTWEWIWNKSVLIDYINITLNNCTATTANMNCSRYVTIKICPIILIATNTDLTTSFWLIDWLLLLLIHTQTDKWKKKHVQNNKKKKTFTTRGQCESEKVNIKWMSVRVNVWIHWLWQMSDKWFLG